MHPKQIQIADYDYELPNERIAKYPLEERDASKLLLSQNNQLSSHSFDSISQLLPADSLLVFNNTKVIKARLLFTKTTGATIEIFCLEPHSPSDYALSLQSTTSCTWKCFVGNLKRWKEKTLRLEAEFEGTPFVLNAEIKERLDEAFLISFEWTENLCFSEVLTAVGQIPIPPYLNRKTETIDQTRYQTVFSQEEGSVAAPTAGLHFTPKVLQEIEDRGIASASVTLHVGAGTFKPVQTAEIGGHAMHTEHFYFEKQLIEQLLQKEAVVAIGTTSVRSLESIYHIGRKLIAKDENPFHITQWEAYDSQPCSKADALQALLNHMEDKESASIQASTDIMIVPGYSFQIVSAIVTNFHQPKSTLLLLVSAFTAGNWKELYQYALNHDYRFLSYGDSSLLL